VFITSHVTNRSNIASFLAKNGESHVAVGTRIYHLFVSTALGKPWITLGQDKKNNNAVKKTPTNNLQKTEACGGQSYIIVTEQWGDMKQNTASVLM